MYIYLCIYIGIRILLGQYMALRNPHTPDDDMIGLISLKCSSHDIARDAIKDAAYMCERVHGDAPKVKKIKSLFDGLCCLFDVCMYMYRCL